MDMSLPRCWPEVVVYGKLGHGLGELLEVIHLDFRLHPARPESANLLPRLPSGQSVPHQLAR